jgi:hypothetical protein
MVRVVSLATCAVLICSAGPSAAFKTREHEWISDRGFCVATKLVRAVAWRSASNRGRYEAVRHLRRNRG